MDTAGKDFFTILRAAVIISLSVLSEVGATPLCEAARTNDVAAAKGLVAQGHPIDEKDKQGRSPLYWAAQKGNLEAVKFLVQHGADVETFSVGDDRWTPLIISTYGKHKSVTAYLLEQDVKVDTKDDDGFTALSWAWKQESEDMVQMLLARGASMNVPLIGIGDRPIKGGADMFLQVAIGREYGVEFINELISRGANVNARDKDGVTALHIVAGNGNMRIAELLLQQNADVNAATRERWMRTPLGIFGEANMTPLHRAVENLHLDIVKLLVNNRAFMNARCSGTTYTERGHLRYSNLTPLGLAEFMERHKPRLNEYYRPISQYLRNYLKTGGAEAMVQQALEDYSSDLRRRSRVDDAQRMEEHARAFAQALRSSGSVYLGFDPSALLEDYAEFLKERGEIDRSRKIEELAAWYWHANISGAIKAAEDLKERKSDGFDWQQDAG